jgi:ribose transport system substrate-binding protein
MRSFRKARSISKAHYGTPVIALFGLLALLVIAGCGSSSSSSSSGSTATTSSTGGEETTANGPDVNKAYAPGIATLAEMYKGSETPPPSTGPKAKPGVEAIWVSCGQEAPGCAGPADAFSEVAKALGWNYRIIDGKLNVDEGWANGVRTAVAAKPDVIIVHGESCPEIKQPLEEAKAEGIPVAEIESVDCDASLAGSGEKLYSVGVEFTPEVKDTPEFYEQRGREQAAYLIDATEGKGKIIQFKEETYIGKYQAIGQDEVLEKCTECEILKTVEFATVEQVPSGPLAEKAASALVQNPEANAVIVTFDTNLVTGGVAKAVVDSGRSSEITVVGSEGYSEALQLVREEKGDNAEPISYDSHWTAWKLGDEINRYLNGEKSVPEGLGFVAIDKEHNLPPEGQDYQTKIDFKKAYESIWKGK